MSVLSFHAFMQQWRWQQVSFPNFFGSCHVPWNVPDFVNENDREMISISCDKMSFTGGWPRFATILEMILCPSILPRAYCDVFAAVHIILPPDGMTAPAGLDLVSAVRGARGHSVFSGDLIGLAWLHRCTDLVDSCHESESCGLALGAETQGIGARAKRRFKMEICTPLQAAHPGTRISEGWPWPLREWAPQGNKEEKKSDNCYSNCADKWCTLWHLLFYLRRASFLTRCHACTSLRLLHASALVSQVVRVDSERKHYVRGKQKQTSL